MRCILVGNYGIGNLGDEALRDYFLRRFPQVQWTILSAAPSSLDDVPRLPFGLRSFFMPWWKTLLALRRADAVVFGGGSLFTDAESVRACLLWWWHGAVARIFGKRLVMAFQGIGPFRTGVGEWCARWIVRRCAFLSVRDDESARRVRGWAGPRCILSFDPTLAFLEDAAHHAKPSSRILAVIPRANSGARLLGAVRSSLARERWDAVWILPMQSDSSNEKSLCRSLAESAGALTSVHDVRSMQQLIGDLAQCSFLITERYHGALAGCVAGLPMEIVSQAPGDKLSAFDALRRDGVAMHDLRARLREGERELQKFIDMLK